MGGHAGGALDSGAGAALQHGHWRSFSTLSSMLGGIERFLAAAGFDRAPWLAVGFAGGIGAWFALDDAWQWSAWIAACLGLAVMALAALAENGRFPYLRQSLAALLHQWLWSRGGRCGDLHCIREIKIIDAVGSALGEY